MSYIFRMSPPEPVRLFGSYTSPFVRRIRIVCLELGVPFSMVDTMTPEGQADLRQRSPIWKVPAAEIDGQLVLDSHVISDVLLARYGGLGPLASLALDDTEGRNAVSVIDGALDALINVFYLAKDGVTPEQVPYLEKQRARAASALSWLDARVHEPFVTSKQALGLPEVALGTALGWMRFRNAYPIGTHPRLMRCLEALEARPSFLSTAPA